MPYYAFCRSSAGALNQLHYMKRKFLLFVSLAFSTAAMAQEFKVDAQLRPRFESRNGFGKLRPANDNADEAANLISQRARLGLGYKNDEGNIRFKFTLQDVRTWGDLPQTNTTNKGSFTLHEAWGELMLSRDMGLKLGRQEINLDNARIMGNLDWAQQGRAHDAAMLNYEGDFNLKLAAALNTNGETLVKSVYDVANYKSMQLLWLNKKFDHVNASLLFLNNGMEYNKDTALVNKGFAKGRAVAYSQTMGGRVEFRQNMLGFNLEAYYQTGKDNLNTSLSAYDAIAELVLKPRNFTVTLGTEFLSGTDQDETDGKNHSFNPFYGTNHKFNGYMDYFYVGGRYLNSRGLNDIYGSVVYNEKKLSLELAMHGFNAMGNVLDAEKNSMKKYLGFETDFVASYQLHEMAALQAGFSFLKGTSTLETLTGGDKSKLSTWGWISVNIKPTLFLSSM